MGGEWREVGLNELGEVARGRSRHRPRYAEHLYGGPYPFIQTGDVKASGGLITSHSQTYSEAGLAQSRLWPEGTLCITIAANIAETGILTYPACFPDSVIGFIADEEKCDVRFIEYRLRYLKSQLQREAIGSVQDNINLATFERLRFSIPSIQEQKRIAQILGSLDDKIELNRQINATLEAMAQALFKSWFVDFDPVIDNALAAGNPIPDELQTRAEARAALGDKRKPLPEAIQKQFPSSFVFSEEMGWIPEGWEILPLSKLIDIKHGFAFKGEFFSDVPTDNVLLTPGNFRIGGGFKADKLKYYSGPVPEEYVLEPKDLVVTMTDLSKDADTLGFPAFVPKTAKHRYLHNQRLGKVQIIQSNVKKEFLYWCFCSKSYRDEVLSSYSGTTVKHTSPKKIMAHIIAVPGRQEGNFFEHFCLKFTDKRNCNHEENYFLTKLRDTLLPRLLSGQLRIPDAEKLVAEVEQ